MPTVPPLVLRILPTLDFGGAESRVTLQAQLHDRADYTLRVCTFHRDGAAAAKIRAAGVPVDSLNVDPRVRNPRATTKLARYLRELGPDVVHSSIVEANVHTALARRLARVGCHIAEEVGMPEHGFAARAVHALVYRAASVAVGVSEATCDYMVKVDHAPKARVRLIYNCAGPEYFPQMRSPVHRTQTPELKLLIAGRLVAVKNYETVLKAVAGVASSGRNAKLTIAGEGPLRSTLEQLARELGIAERVEFLGFRSDVRDLMLSSDAYLLPSHSEGCSISLVEAMASALPPITSQADGNLEVLGPLAAEWAIPTTNVEAWTRALLHLANMSAAERTQLAERAQERAYAAFSPAVYLGNLTEIYHEVCTSS